MSDSPGSPAPQDYLFVYGTLRSDAFSDYHRQLIAPHFSLVGRAAMPGRLYAIVDYPGMIAAQQATNLVIGEIYGFTGGEQALSELDEYEGCAADSPQPHLYTRTRQAAWLTSAQSAGEPAEQEAAKTIQAWVYLYNFPVNESMLIRSGDFLDPL